MNRLVLSLLVENNPGVLSRVAGLFSRRGYGTVSYTHLRAHETGRNLVCRLLLEKKKKIKTKKK